MWSLCDWPILQTSGSPGAPITLGIQNGNCVPQETLDQQADVLTALTGVDHDEVRDYLWYPVA